MTYAGVQMFMGKLNQLINSNEIPLFNYPEVICQRPQFQLLYDELSSMGQPLFIDQHQDLHDLQKVSDLKQRFIDAAEEAEHIVDLFLSAVHIRNNGHSPTSGDFNRSLNLDDVRTTFKFVKVELMSMRIDSMKVDSYPRPESNLNESAPATTGISINSQGSKKLMDEIVVGIDCDVELIRDKLVEDEKKLDVVSIVGMGGIGKTTLATRVFNDAYVKHHFHVRAWVTASQTYDKRGLLVQILEPICGQLDLEKASDLRLREMVFRHLIGKRYLIVIDDIWDIKTWDILKLFFPHDNNGSRILLTSRLTEVAKHVNPYGLIHHLGSLNKTKSWKLLCEKAFHGSECPEWSITPGRKIVESCRGLPLALVVIAGVLATDVWSKKLWEEIADRTGSYLVGDQNGYLETLNLSYDHLPLYLRECFLYLGGFPEDYEFQVQRLIWLWVAEGFIQADGNRRLEDIAEGYLMDLIDRNLVIVSQKSTSSGAVKVCILHDLVRELCLKKAVSSYISIVTARPYKVARLFINDDSHILGLHYVSCPHLRSILCLTDFTTLRDDIAKCFCSFVLLRVLDLQKCVLSGFPKDMELLVHLRYLAIWNSSADFPPSLCNFWSLQTLIYITGQNVVDLPSNISDLVNLRHLWRYFPCVNAMKVRKSNMPFFLPSIRRPMNLQTISNVELGNGLGDFQRCFPYIKELTCTTYLDEENDFRSLTYLEKLKLTVVHRSMLSTPYHITFPPTLETLTLVGLRMPWSYMSIIQSLPHLKVLKLRDNAFEGHCWNTDEQKFRQLKFLRLERLDIEQWEVYSASVPCLRRLEIISCKYLEEIPLEIGDIPTLELIKIKKCSQSVGESVRRILEEQHDLGNFDLTIDVLEEKL